MSMVTRWFKLLRFVLTCLFLLSSFPIPVSATSTPPPIQPELLKLAQIEPKATIGVIVQKINNDLQPETEVARLGGKVTKNLSIIKAFAAELPAAQVLALAELPNVRWVSLDAPMVETGCTDCINTGKLQNVYNQAVRADLVWNAPGYLQGKGVTIAVVDSGIQSAHPDLANRVIAEKSIKWGEYTNDGFGHGTYVAGIIAGKGVKRDGAYIGIAPRANIVNVKVTTLAGASAESDIVAGLQWIYENRDLYHIRVVNLSLNSAQAQSYHTSPLNAACEILWFNGIVVVVSAGNHGEGVLYPPANDPFVITVGATDDKGTVSIQDDTIANFSAFGKTSDGFAKPDLVAPGRKMVGALSTPSALLAILHPTQVVNKSYFRMSGTSVAAPVISGAVALLLQDEPNLTPDQVKYRLLATANKNWPGYNPTRAGAGYLDIYAAVYGTTTESANTGLAVSNLLTTGPTGVLTPSVGWNSVSWSSVSWSSVSWSSVSWSSVSWSSVSWSSDYWEDGTNKAFNTEFELDEEPLTDSTNAQINGQTLTLFLPIIVGNEN